MKKIIDLCSNNVDLSSDVYFYLKDISIKIDNLDSVFNGLSLAEKSNTDLIYYPIKVEKIKNNLIPDIFKNYLDLPLEFRNTKKIKDNLTAKELLLNNLSKINMQLDAVEAELTVDSVHNLLVSDRIVSNNQMQLATQPSQIKVLENKFEYDSKKSKNSTQKLIKETNIVKPENITNKKNIDNGAISKLQLTVVGIILCCIPIVGLQYSKKFTIIESKVHLVNVLYTTSSAFATTKNSFPLANPLTINEFAVKTAFNDVEIINANTVEFSKSTFILKPSPYGNTLIPAIEINNVDKRTCMAIITANAFSNKVYVNGEAIPSKTTSSANKHCYDNVKNKIELNH